MKGVSSRRVDGYVDAVGFVGPGGSFVSGRYRRLPQDYPTTRAKFSWAG